MARVARKKLQLPDEGVPQDALRGLRSSLVREARARRTPSRPRDVSGRRTIGLCAEQARLLEALGLSATRLDPPLPASLEAGLAELSARFASQPTTMRAAPRGRGGAWRALLGLLEGPLRGHARALARIATFWPFWVRTPDIFRTRARTPEGIVRALVDHVFVRFPVPPFLYQGWTDEEAPCALLGWFVCLAGGGSLRRLEKASGGLGGASARALRPMLDLVSPGASLVEGRTRAEVMAMGGSSWAHEQLFDAAEFQIFSPHAVRSVVDYDTWRQTVRWLDRHREVLTPDSLPATLGWIAREHARLRISGGRFALEAQTLSDVQNAMKACADRSWPVRFGDWDFGPVRFVELLNEGALHDEGKAMHHCVATYAEDCADGTSAIFSVRRGGQRLLTVEVLLTSRSIYEARGKHNRSLFPSERRVLLRWAQEVLKNPRALRELSD